MPTVIITVLVTLVFDWWVKPRFEVRNEMFRMRAQDRIALIRTLNSMMISCGQMIGSEHEDAETHGVLQSRAQDLRENLPKEAHGLQAAMVSLGDRLTPATREMLSKSYGFIIRLCHSSNSHKIVGQYAAVPVGLLLDAVSAQRYTINHWYQQRRLRQWMEHHFSS
ncbi:hypothetical protein D477_000839 [Arthrobacter crystallopoietes BAB-32]|uniref:Uncharacterized protein n=1 Tax=Arthrobacter crystallopoietes BAB-32 TaxID=1246476 RepID=N1V7W8_9MICC|nr:hypothetical protein D477_000839 [Arthrobacter crystallopoietes BAB-32]